MAILDFPRASGICPKCGSKDVEVMFRRLECSKSSVITKKWTKCNACGYEG
ncbi:MAG: hypothetical protein QMD36_00120 [Candidatus Aenigmarchaeota archaeon]|nr:hypothetical protein [Candidatus Aenigmarchaeota archaeon]